MTEKRMVPLGHDGAKQPKYAYALIAPAIDSAKWRKANRD